MIPYPKKLISIVMPTFNEEEVIVDICGAVKKAMSPLLENYEYEHIIIDNASTDATLSLLEGLAKEDPRIKVIVNAKNFGPIRSPFYGIMQAYGDCVIQMVADFQDPPDMLEPLIQKWEEGHEIVIAVKDSKNEKGVIRIVRNMYYKFMKKISDVEHIEHFCGFGLYSKRFVDVMRSLDDPQPYLRGIVSELGCNIATVKFVQPHRKAGHTKTSFLSLYDSAMLGITSYSKIPLRAATLLGFIVSAFSLFVAIIYFIVKLLFWAHVPMGIAPIVIGIFFIGSVQLFFIGMLGEYILSINTRMLRRPLIIESRRINMDGYPVSLLNNNQEMEG